VKRYTLIQKEVGQTPLQALEAYREEKGISKEVPMAYAGRLDPMASGTLLILLGDECKKQAKYHSLDKRYEFTVLFGVSSDTGDVLGRIKAEEHPPEVRSAHLRRVLGDLRGPITLPYPHFSSKTVGGKPLHMWTLEGKIREIDIPTYTARIYNLSLLNIETKTGDEIAQDALTKIETIPPVTESSKELGRDFRRSDVRRDWSEFKDAHGDEIYHLARIACTTTSGLYMRSLAEVIAKELGTSGLAFGIHRTHIGRYRRFLSASFWQKP